MTVVTLLVLAGCGPGAVQLKDSDGAPQDTDPGDTGPVVAEGFTISPPQLDLGIVFLGGSASGQLEVTNTGDQALALQFTVEGIYASAYGVNVDDPNPGPGAVANVSLLLAPTNWGDHAAELTVTNSGGDSAIIPVAALVQEDGDGDGHGSVATGGDDCVDTDTSVHPGAEETWYDGVDQDCAGDDDYDQDHDGVTVDADCLDTDATVYPGAEDAWYDGIDSDCAGDDDYDQDADGWTVDVDCDDENPDVWPGAPETWYDGVDSDCAGDGDYDQDHDGHDSDTWGGDDCDDLVASTYSGAPDTWYDGVDSDCAGDNDYDQDLDGVDYPTDCNDTDPTVTGPEAETWDGIDNDCSGYVDDFTVTALASATWYGAGSDAVGGNNGVSLGGDADDDGVDDLVVASASASTYGTAWVVSGADLYTGGSLDTLGLASVTGSSSNSGDADYYPVAVTNGPMWDVDGDGRADLLIGGGYVRGSSEHGSFALVDGAELSGSLTLPGDGAAHFYGDTTSGDYVKQGATGDLTGDGTPEIVVAGVYDNYTTGSPSTDASGVVAIFVGSGWNTYYDFQDADHQVNGEDDNDYLGWSMVVADLTGDGYDDIITGAAGFNDGSATNAGAVYVIPGNSAGTWSDEVVDGIATVRIVGASSNVDLGSDAIPTPGDYDGDGDLDLALADADAYTAWIFLGGSVLAGELSTADADVTVTGSAGFATAAAAVDFDGDGADELVVGASGADTAAANAGAVYLFGGGWSTSLAPTDARGVLWGADAEDGLGTGLANGVDLDADGKEELVIGATGADDGGSGSGALYVVGGR